MKKPRNAITINKKNKIKIQFKFWIAVKTTFIYEK